MDYIRVGATVIMASFAASSFLDAYRIKLARAQSDELISRGEEAFDQIRTQREKSKTEWISVFNHVNRMRADASQALLWAYEMADANFLMLENIFRLAEEKKLLDQDQLSIFCSIIEELRSDTEQRNIRLADLKIVETHTELALEELLADKT